ncbi:MAG: hypothetical protein OEZ16_02280 [Chromatiales bacterium]|nr:hypothetical protein [Chromatiales bacterium]
MALKQVTGERIPYGMKFGAGSTLFIVFLLLTPINFFIDSIWMGQKVAGSQWLSNIIVLLLFLLFYKKGTRRLRRLMRYGIPIAIFGETLFSQVLGMYEYRLGSIPIYVFLGHSVVYATVYLLVREDWFKESKIVQPLMLLGSTALAFYWLVKWSDLLGFLCFAGILLVYHRAGSNRLFYLTMLCVVAYLELLGTFFGCWYWPDYWFGTVTWMPSGNPPTGIALVYFLFDLGCLWIYKHRNIIAWRRMRRIQRLR